MKKKTRPTSDMIYTDNRSNLTWDAKDIHWFSWPRPTPGAIQKVTGDTFLNKNTFDHFLLFGQNTESLTTHFVEFFKRDKVHTSHKREKYAELFL